MVKPSWGIKRTCHGCGAHFYDLQRDPAVCPKCQLAFNPEAVLKLRRANSFAPAKAAAAMAVVAEAVDEPLDAVDAEDDENENDEADTEEDDAEDGAVELLEEAEADER